MLGCLPGPAVPVTSGCHVPSLHGRRGEPRRRATGRAALVRGSGPPCEPVPECGLKGVLGGLHITEELPHTLKTIAPWRSTSTAKAASAVSSRRARNRSRSCRSVIPVAVPATNKVWIVFGTLLAWLWNTGKFSTSRPSAHCRLLGGSPRLLTNLFRGKLVLRPRRSSESICRGRDWPRSQ